MEAFLAVVVVVGMAFGLNYIDEKHQDDDVIEYVHPNDVNDPEGLQPSEENTTGFATGDDKK